MAASIHGLACSFVKGYSGPMREQLIRWNVPGIDGTGVHLIGQQGHDTRIQAVIISTVAGAKTWYDSLAALTGAIGVVVNDEGQSMADQLIVNVGPVQPSTADDLNVAKVRYEVEVVCQTQS